MALGTLLFLAIASHQPYRSAFSLCASAAAAAEAATLHARKLAKFIKYPLPNEWMAFVVGWSITLDGRVPRRIQVEALLLHICGWRCTPFLVAFGASNRFSIFVVVSGMKDGTRVLCGCINIRPVIMLKGNMTLQWLLLIYYVMKSTKSRNLWQKKRSQNFHVSTFVVLLKQKI